MGFWNYSNPAWEPAFELISPKLARLYFSTNFGPIKWFAATAMFKALGEMEDGTRKWMEGVNGFGEIN